MECNIISPSFQPCSSRLYMNRIGTFQAHLAGWKGKSVKLNGVLIGKTTLVHNVHRRVFRTAVSLEERFLTIQSKNVGSDDESSYGDSMQDDFPRPPSNEELKALLADSERSNLVKKLSEANQQNRFLKRQLQVKEEALVNFKSELAQIELEIQGLVSLAAEIANYRIPTGSRKINGKYIQSHLLSHLQAVHGKLEEQIKDVDVAQPQEVPLSWHGVAESVQVMGSFNGWFEREHLSPEYTGSYSTFSTKLMLRPGRYEIKFLVDGDWKLSPELPIVGEGLMQNNLLIVE